MKILLVGPCPPPHGGVSVHVANVHRQLIAAGMTCRVLDSERVSRRPGFAVALLRHAFGGWTVHLHTNGHNSKSWLVALLCALAGRLRGDSILTLHSGMAPGFLELGSGKRRLARFVCWFYKRVICVSPAIQSALVGAGVPSSRTEVLPAWIPPCRATAPLDLRTIAWIKRRQPLFSTAMIFRPEYGLDLLLEGLMRLRAIYPRLGCLVLGGDARSEEVSRRIHAAKLDDHVLLLGDMDHEMCLSAMSASDVFIRPTRADGDAVSVREALSLGVPVVASDVGMRPEGVLLYRAEDTVALARKVEDALGEHRGTRTAGPASCMDRLMEIYLDAPQKTGGYDAARIGA